MKITPLTLVLLVSACRIATPDLAIPATAHWSKLPTAAYKGKQDDLFFLDANLGWYVNGEGKIYKTEDGGQHWVLKLSQPGTYFRAIGFVDAQHGFAGNISTDYFPGVTDATPLYETVDGGDSWAAVKDFPLPKGGGSCAIDIVQDNFVNAGVLSHRAIISVAGRVGGPAYLVRSVDSGAHWQLIDLQPYAAMVLDVKFFDASTGYVAGATDREIERSHALVLRTTDGGQTWKKVYASKRPFEMAWKESFPSRDVGYVTIMNYNEDASVTARVVAKTRNGGRTWRELPLDSDHEQQEFGVAFASDKLGWVGAVKGGYETVNGGKTWKRVDLGRLVNKIRVVPTKDGFVGYAIGSSIFKLDARAGADSVAKK